MIAQINFSTNLAEGKIERAHKRLIHRTLPYLEFSFLEVRAGIKKSGNRAEVVKKQQISFGKVRKYVYLCH